MLSAVLPTSLWEACRGTATGVALWESYTASHELSLRREEQPLLYSWNVSSLIALLNYNVFPNILPSCGGIIGRVALRVFLKSHYVIFFVSMNFMHNKKNFDNANRKISNLKATLPQGSFEQASLGDVSTTQMDTNTLERQFPANHSKDRRPLSQRINETDAWVSSPQSRVVYWLGSFLLTHIGQVALFITLGHSCISIYLGKNLLTHTIQTFFCLVCLGEQGLFWVNPTYNRGPLCTLFDGGVSRFIRKMGFEFRVTKYLVRYMAYGLLSKIWVCTNAGVYLTVRLFPRQIQSLLSRAIVLGVNKILKRASMETIFEESDANLEVMGGRFRVSNTAFTCLQFQDPCPNTDVKAMEKELLDYVKANKETTPALQSLMEESNKALVGREARNSDLLEQLLDNGGGEFSRHVSTATEGRSLLTLQSKLVLHICLYELKRGNIFFLRKLVDRAPDFESCPQAVKRVISDLSGECVAESSIGKGYVNQTALSLLTGVKEGEKPLPTLMGLLMVLQSTRERLCSEIIQKNVSLPVWARLQGTQKARQECPNLVDQLMMRGERLVTSLVGGYMRRIPGGNYIPLFPIRGIVRWILRLLFDICFALQENAEEEAMSIGVNDHYVNIMRSALADNLGLSIQPSAHLDPSLSSFLSGNKDGGLFQRILIPVIVKTVFAGYMRNQYALEMLPELKRVLLDSSDTRLDINDMCDTLRESLREKGVSDDEIDRTLDKYLKLDPTGETYRTDAGSLIDEFLPKMLLTLGLLQDGAKFQEMCRQNPNTSLDEIEKAFPRTIPLCEDSCEEDDGFAGFLRFIHQGGIFW